MLRDMLHRLGYTGTLAYRGRLYREFGHGRCEVHMDVVSHPSDLSMMAMGDDLDDTLERAAH
jgi:hypothetical protein